LAGCTSSTNSAESATANGHWQVDAAGAARELGHASGDRLLVGQAVLVGIVADLLGDLHGAELRPAHRAEVRGLGVLRAGS
jgi:hypothetical protein